MPRPLSIRRPGRPKDLTTLIEHLTPLEWEARVALLNRVRTGDAEATKTLWDRYRCRLILPEQAEGR